MGISNTDDENLNKTEHNLKIRVERDEILPSS